MTITSNSGLTECENTSFAASCRRQGFHSEQFRIAAEHDDLSVDTSAPMTRTISITHVRYGCRRLYRVDHFFGWLDAFKDDLRNGFFHAWGGGDWVSI